jgi:signal peptidase I
MKIHVMETESERIESAETAASVPSETEGQSRGFIAEWAVTILLILFASTSLAWSYVIPTGSMEDTLLIGDHIID